MTPSWGQRVDEPRSQTVRRLQTSRRFESDYLHHVMFSCQRWRKHCCDAEYHQCYLFFAHVLAWYFSGPRRPVAMCCGITVHVSISVYSLHSLQQGTTIIALVIMQAHQLFFPFFFAAIYNNVWGDVYLYFGSRWAFKTTSALHRSFHLMF